MSLDLSSILGVILLVFSAPSDGDQTAPTPAPVIDAPAITDPSGPAETNDHITALSCAVISSGAQGRQTYLLELTAGDGPVSGAYDYVFNQDGASWVQLRRSGQFSLSPGESVILGRQSISVNGDANADFALTIDGVRTACDTP